MLEPAPTDRLIPTLYTRVEKEDEQWIFLMMNFFRILACIIH
jgi:hypothetical protein